MNLTLRENYWDQPILKKQFIDFLIRIHRLDLSLWDRFGYWDTKYRPFSFFKDNLLVSSLCVYSMDMTVQGKRCLAAQISGVGTLPEFRRQGLNLKLIRKAIEWAAPNHDFFFLFADKEAYHFYKKCGFCRVDEYKAVYEISGVPAKENIVKLNVRNKKHRDLIYRCAAGREPVSDILGIRNERLFMFWCLYFLKDDIYYIEELDTLVLYERQERLLTIFDVVGKKVPPFSEIYPYIGNNNDKTVEFLFMTDKMNPGRPKEIRLIEDGGTHLYGNFPLENSEFLFPCTSHA